MYALDALPVELSVSLKGGGAQKSVSTTDTTLVLHRLPRESHFVPYSPTRKGCSPWKSAAVTPIHLSYSVDYISLLLPPTWNSCQDRFHPPPVLLAYQNPKPTSSQWTRWPKPGAPETSFWGGLEFNTSGQEHGHLLIGKLDGQSAAWLPHHDTRVQICCRLYWEKYSILNSYCLDRGPPHHPPLAPEPPWPLCLCSCHHQWSLSVAPM